MLRQRLAIAAATPNLIPMPVAHVPLDRSTRQIAVHPYSLPLENRCSHSSNPHRSQRRHRAPSGPRFRALALLGRLSWERVDGFVMQTSEKPAHKPAVPAKGGERPGWAGRGRSGSGSENEVLDIRFASLVRLEKSDPSLPNLGRLAPIADLNGRLFVGNRATMRLCQSPPLS
jgi:hypothetical protein